MANKHIISLVSIFIFTLNFSFIWAQTDESAEPVAAPEQNFFIEETEGGAVFKQKLSWQPIRDILRYEIIIDKKTSGSEADTDEYTQVIETIKTEESYIFVSLGFGVYRYKILVINLLDRLEIESDWYNFEVRRAIQPKLSSASPSAIYLEEENDGIFSIDGAQLSNETVYSLRQIDKKTDSYRAEIISINEKGTDAKVQFDMNVVDVGVYDVVVTNPGGLYDQKGPISIKFKKAIDFDISAGYTLPVFVNDTVIGHYLGSTMWPLSAAARISFLPIKRRFGYFGINITPLYTRMTYNADTYSITGNLFIAQANIVYQYPIIKQRLVLDVHAGSGIAFFNDFMFAFDNDVVSETLNSISITANAGVAAQLYVMRRLYIELCVDFVKPFISDMSANIIVPIISAGYQL